MEPDLTRRYATAFDMLNGITVALRQAVVNAEGKLPANAESRPQPRPVAPVVHNQETSSLGGDSSRVDAKLLVPLEVAPTFVPSFSFSSSIHSGSQPQATTHPSVVEQRPADYRQLWAVGARVGLTILVGGLWMSQRPAQPQSSSAQTSSVNNADGNSRSVEPVGLAPSTAPWPASREGMVYIPPGRVHLGATEDRLRAHANNLLDVRDNPVLVEQFVAACQNERLETVQLEGFWIDAYEATNAEYARFLEETGHSPPTSWTSRVAPTGLEDHPVTQIGYDDATAYRAGRARICLPLRSGRGLIAVTTTGCILGAMLGSPIGLTSARTHHFKAERARCGVHRGMSRRWESTTWSGKWTRSCVTRSSRRDKPRWSPKGAMPKRGATSTAQLRSSSCTWGKMLSGVSLVSAVSSKKINSHV